MSKTRVAVLRGGPSEEFDVSLRTGECMLAALDTRKHQPLDVVITKAGEWLLSGRVRAAEDILAHTDVALLALHGQYGEDGGVQRLLERHGVPFTGSGSYASAIAMNKAITKDQVRHHGVMVPKHMVAGSSARDNTIGMAHSIKALFGPKYVIKPISSGSSLGVRLVHNVEELSLALGELLALYDTVLVEEYIEGKEATCGVIEGFRGQDVYALPVVEIVPPKEAGFFAAHVKYTGATEEICPARFSTEDKKTIEELSKTIHRALGLSHYSRSDFIVSDRGIYFLEVNTLPGMTSESLFPKSLAAIGAKYEDFIAHLLTVAQERPR
jgi:D-alanine-D-alanine ligase